MNKIKVIDLFCGAGGFTSGVEDAVFKDNKIADVVACINHDPKAIKSHAANHPSCKHYTEDITIFNEHQLPTKKSFKNAILLLHGSLECIEFSKAKGGKEKKADSRTLGNHLPRYIKWCNPDIVTIENVREFLAWGEMDDKGKPISRLKGRDFMKWRYSIEDLGYRYEHRFLNSANFGAHTSRERYFGMFVKKNMPIVFPEATHDKKERNGLKKWNAVKEKLDFTNEGKSIFDRKKELAPATLKRIFSGLVKYVGNGETGFLSKYFSGHPDSKNSSLNDTTGTITTIDHHSLIMPDFLGDGKSFITKYYGTGKNIADVNDALPTISTKDRFALYFIQKYYTSGGDLQSIEQPAGTIMNVDKHRLITCNSFIDKQYSGETNHQSIEKPCGTITQNNKNCLVRIELADKKHFLFNPQFNNVGNSIDQPCPVIIARQDKRPIGLISCESGYSVGIIVNDSDSEPMKKIKYFMVEHGIIDIKMRMLTVMELNNSSAEADRFKYRINPAEEKHKL